LNYWTVSVVIPILNRQRLGERALVSACAQTVDGTEIIIVDDGSDPPFRLPPTLPQPANVRLVRHETTCGAGVARNSGIAAARGEWIALLDSDDYWPPATLEPRLNLAASVSDRSALIAWAAGFVLHRKGARTGDLRIPREATRLEEFVCGCWFAPGSTILLRRQVFERIGPFDPELPRLEDYDWFMRFALAGGCLRVWKGVAAVVEVQGKPPRGPLEAAAASLLRKYAHPESPHKLPEPMVRRLKAMLDVERASISRYRHQWLSTFFYLARSFLRVPRATIQLRRFWTTERY